MGKSKNKNKEKINHKSQHPEEPQWSWKQSFLLGGLSVLLLSLSFITFLPFHISFLGWVALIPWLLLLRQNTLKRVLVVGFFTALFFIGVVVYWIGMVTPAGYLVGVLILSLYLTLFNFFGYQAYRCFPRWGGLFIPFLWILVQYCRSSLFFIRFPWYLLGYSQAENDWIIQSADLWGIFGVSLVLVFVNLTLAEGLYKGLRRQKETLRPLWTFTAITLVLLIFTISYSLVKKNNLQLKPSLTFSIIQGNIPQELKSSGLSIDEIQKAYMDLTRQALRGQPFDLALWPETMLTLTEGNVRELRELIKNSKRPMLVGAARAWPEKGEIHYANSALYFGGDGDLVTGPKGDWKTNQDGKRVQMGIYDKVHLVPLSEYIPFKKGLPPLYRFLKSWIPPGFVSMDHGEGPMVFTLKGQKFSPSVCFEISFPDLSREAVQRGADCLINISNDAWFKDSAELDNSRLLGRVRAIETRRAVVRALNAGISCFVDADGTITDLKNKNGKKKQISGVLTWQVKSTGEKTLYVRWGDWVVYFCLVMFLILLVALIKEKLKKGED